eukprot:m.212552 g.212552  ORF g.212552 m.212552 type:complete len:300 (+) comp15854_c0_seq12:1631-2530(+)
MEESEEPSHLEFDSDEDIDISIVVQSPLSPFRKKESETEEPSKKIERLEHSVAHLNADLFTMRRRLKEAKIAAKQHLLREWIPNENVTHCTSCRKEFSILFWRWHCRVCGQIFCSDCTQRRIKTPVNPRPQRCCDSCYDDAFRLQRIRDLRRDVEVSAENSDYEEVDVSTLVPYACYSPDCRRGLTSKCYNASCVFRSSEGALIRQSVFATLVLSLKRVATARKHEDQIKVCASDLYEIAMKLKVPSQRYSKKKTLSVLLTNLMLDGMTSSASLLKAPMRMLECVCSISICMPLIPSNF